MKHILNLDTEKEYLADHVFRTIGEGNAILFLGAGASATEKVFLGKQIIDYYSDYKHIDIGTNNLTEYVDILSSKSDFDRNDLDSFIADMILKLQVSEEHRIIAGIQWREIITTNFDLLIEKAFDDICQTSARNLKLHPVRSVGDYNYYPANDELRYIKLHGCVSDKKKYPFVLSTRDFEKAAGFYKTALRPLENLSPSIVFISVGYSFADPLSKELMKRFDKYNYLTKRSMISIDPYVLDSNLDYLSQQCIAVVRTTSSDFFALYKQWEAEKHGFAYAKRIARFTNIKHDKIQISAALSRRLYGSIQQLADDLPQNPVAPQDYYRGEEPSFDVVKKNFDVVRSLTLTKVWALINDLQTNNDNLVPILLLTGSFGIGKSTFCYRLIEELLHNCEIQTAAFEVVDPYRLSAIDLGELFRASGAKNIMVLFNGIEIDSMFKGLLELRTKLSIEQFQDFNITLVSSIRYNILIRHKQTYSYRNMHEVVLEDALNEAEANQLIDKLDENGLVSVRDNMQKKQLVQRVISEFSGDPLISLISIVTGSNHKHILNSAYTQLSSHAKKAFLFTSLLYRFRIQAPSTLLRRLISKDWDTFRKDVLEYDCKGLLIHDEISSTGTDPDLYFRTRHPILSEELIKLYLPNEDDRFSRYQELIRNVTPSPFGAKLIVDLLKAIRFTSDMSQEKINKLFDTASSQFEDDPHFILHYAINLQHRGDEAALKRGIHQIVYVESLLDERNHRLTHRRATLNSILAKLIFERTGVMDSAEQYVREARELFKIKAILDPFSFYSYLDHLRLEIWYLQCNQLDEKARVSQIVLVEDLFDRAKTSVLENAHLIANLRAEYLRTQQTEEDGSDSKYVKFLEEIYVSDDLRPYSLILKYFYYERLGNTTKCEQIIAELESYRHIDDVCKALFRHYSKHLHIADVRKKLFEIVRLYPNIQVIDPMRYHYFSYVAEAYNRNFSASREHITELRERYYASMNPEFKTIWLESDSHNPLKCMGLVIPSNRGFNRVRILDFQQVFSIRRRNYKGIDLSAGTKHQMILHFYLSEIRAEPID